MPRVIETTVYEFDELSDKAKEKARDWWRALEMQDCDLSTTVDDCIELLESVGFTLKTRAVSYVGRGGPSITKQEPCFFYSGFGSQGDGASFAAKYDFVPGFARAVKKERPTNDRLHRLVDRLQALQEKHHRRLTGWVHQHDSHYVHSNTMTTGLGRNNSRGDYYCSVDGDDAEEFKSIVRGFGDWIYHELEADYFSRFEAENVDDNIRANDYVFTAEGKHVG